MNCCGSHKHDNQSASNKNHNYEETEKKSSWLMWFIAVLFIILLVLSFIR